MCNNSIRPDRRTLCGMMMAVDEGVGNITKALEKKGMLNSTLIIFTTDNGGENGAGGNNWPLRGNKATLWEGGVRGVGFLHGNMLNASGHVYHGMLHVTDWLQTLAEGVVGLELNQLSAPIQPLDGFNAWSAISNNSTSPRREILLTLDPPRENGQFVGSAAIRVDNWKLIVGLPNCSSRVWPSANVSKDLCPSGWVHPSGIEIPPPPNPSLTWLFDLDDDPLEKNNLHTQHPDIVAKLRARIEIYNSSHIDQAPSPVDPASDPRKFGGVWTPWRSQ